MSVILFLAFVAIAAGEGCCPPDQWEAGQDIMVGMVTAGATHLSKGLNRVHIDATQKIIAAEESLVVDGAPVQLKVIQDFVKGIQYLIQNSVCQKTTIGPWVSRCVPDNATLVHSVSIGSGKNTLAVKTYNVKQGDLDIYVTVTADGCIPVSQNQAGSSSGVNQMIVVGFYDVTQGIKDRSVFDVPAECNGVAIQERIHPTTKLASSVFHL
ncbi:hypothetical protein ACJMK2_034241 [Sinanodonta woodiana]|uniref:Uncharacterized protein n=1 Tax=Sinanodonta woodiana TaxID=1069815 RepID=A0ABD3WSE3_SINWO